MSLKDKVLDLICKTLDVDGGGLKEDEKLYDSIGVDSTEMVAVVASINKAFNVKIETNEITKFSTPLEIVSVIEKKKQ